MNSGNAFILYRYRDQAPPAQPYKDYFTDQEVLDAENLHGRHSNSA
jgi:hypothetical protein